MTKLTHLALLLASSLLFSACTLPGSQPLENQTQNKPTSPTSPTSAPLAKSKLRDLLSQNQSLKCTINTQTEDVQSEATVYIQNGKSKIISNIKIEGDQAIESNMVVDGDTLYTWQSGQNQGMKINVKNSANTGGNTQNNQGQNFDFDAEYDYNCQPWNSQGESFSPPSTVKFTQMGETLQKIQQNMQGVCDMLQGDAKQDCLDSLKNIPEGE